MLQSSKIALLENETENSVFVFYSSDNELNTTNKKLTFFGKITFCSFNQKYNCWGCVFSNINLS